MVWKISSFLWQCRVLSVTDNRFNHLLSSTASEMFNLQPVTKSVLLISLLSVPVQPGHPGPPSHYTTMSQTHGSSIWFKFRSRWFLPDRSTKPHNRVLLPLPIANKSAESTMHFCRCHHSQPLQHKHVQLKLSYAVAKAASSAYLTCLSVLFIDLSHIKSSL